MPCFKTGILIRNDMQKNEQKRINHFLIRLL